MERIKGPGDVTPAFRPLYAYLEGRFADTVVLTFAQIEDLLGFPLPDRARQDKDWWANAVPNTSLPDHAQSWNVAKRLARPNLQAHIVAFDRVP